MTGGPEDKPAFLDKDRAEAIGYIGADIAPAFDDELEVELPMTADEEPRGKGPTRGFVERWRTIARLHSLGLTNNQIGRKLGYSAPGISLALTKPFVQSEIARFRAAFEADVTSRVKEAAQDGIGFIHETIHNERAKVSERLDASKWAVEKAHGKAKQEIGVESGTLMYFMEQLKEMQNIPAVDVTPALPAPTVTQTADAPSQYDAWLDAHLPPTLP